MNEKTVTGTDGAVDMASCLKACGLALVAASDADRQQGVSYVIYRPMSLLRVIAIVLSIALGLGAATWLEKPDSLISIPFAVAGLVLVYWKEFYAEIFDRDGEMEIRVRRGEFLRDAAVLAERLAVTRGRTSIHVRVV